MTFKKLTPKEEAIIIHKATEPPFSGEYWNNNRQGKYLCKRCGAELFNSTNQFDSHCGWPSFDDQIPNSVKEIADSDGMRTEILCSSCGGHLGHIFRGENFTLTNTRYCVNSLSLNFIESKELDNLPKTYFAGGCFWGVEYYFKRAPGVKSTRCGYMGGNTDSPTYEEVCYDNTGHIETVEVIFDPNLTSFKELCQLFFEIHDPTQIDHQGPDVGYQYCSMIFYTSPEQKNISLELISILSKKGYKIATKLKETTKFWPAELYHQHYYDKNGQKPYCHYHNHRF